MVPNINTYRVTQKTGTFEMRSGSHVQLAALRNRDLELQTTFGLLSLKRQVIMVLFLSIFLLNFFNFCWVFQKFPFFCVSLYIYMCVCVCVCVSLIHICKPGSSVGIATDYGLDGPGSNPGGDEIFCPSRSALGPIQPPVK